MALKWCGLAVGLAESLDFPWQVRLAWPAQSILPSRGMQTFLAIGLPHPHGRGLRFLELGDFHLGSHFGR